MKKLGDIHIMGFFTIALLMVISIAGLLSFNTDHGYFVPNQYGNDVRIFGYGMYDCSVKTQKSTLKTA